MNDEGDEANLGHPTRTRIFDIQDLDSAAVRRRGSTDRTRAATTTCMCTRGWCGRANYTSGLQVLDATNVGHWLSSF
jgi:hypothetical protein